MLALITMTHNKAWEHNKNEEVLLPLDKLSVSGVTTPIKCQCAPNEVVIIYWQERVTHTSLSHASAIGYSGSHGKWPSHQCSGAHIQPV